MTLADLHTGDKGVIVKVRGRGSFRKRILDMGFIRGQQVEVVLNAPLHDPIKYKLMDYEVSLRRSEAALIDVVAEADADSMAQTPVGTLAEHVHHEFAAKTKTIHVALVGNPNAGKTSLFNIASGAHERVGNYSGVTVGAKEGTFKYRDYTFRIVDLPGTYSLTSYSPEELFVRRYLTEQSPDVVVNVVAASALERNLYLTTQLIDMDTYMVIALNMYDELESSGNRLDYVTLGRLIGSPMVPTVATRWKGPHPSHHHKHNHDRHPHLPSDFSHERSLNELFDRIIEVYENREPDMRHIHINYGEVLEESIGRLQDVLRGLSVGSNYSKRYWALSLLEKNGETEHILRNELAQQTADSDAFIDSLSHKRDAEVKRIETLLDEDCEQAFTNARYGFIAGALHETLTVNPERQRSITDLIDPIVTHKYFGYPIFLFFMWLMFTCTFTLGAYPKEWIESGVEALSRLLSATMAPGSLKDLLIDGVIGGVGGVIVFLPNIIILYLFIAAMEDSGYMARAAFIMDKVMHRMGLHGKSFIPLIMGFGCSVPAIMASRTIESRNSRMITILVNPLMSCSARLPVYILMVGAFFPKHGGLVMMAIYITGILLAVVMARLFKRFLFPEEDVPFVMELPPYRQPTAKSVWRHTWQKSAQYLRKMGGIILFASIIIWALGYFPRTTPTTERLDFQIAQSEKAGDTLTMKRLTAERKMIHQEESYIGRIGKAIDPVMLPLGFDWRISVSLLTGMAAKEVVVSTLSVLYSGDDRTQDLGERLASAERADGTPIFTPLIAFCLMLFVLIYFPCIATITAIVNEAGSWKWGAFTIVYTTALAWIVAWIVRMVGMIW